MEAALDQRGHIAVVLGAFLIFFGLFSHFLKARLYLSEPLLSTLAGIVLGPNGLNYIAFVPIDWDSTNLPLTSDARLSLLWFLRVVIGVQVLFAASTLPSRWLIQRENVRSMAVLLLPVMTASWLASSGLVKLCLSGTSWTEALIIGACIAPTDPVLANSVVNGVFAESHVPRHIREVLSAESGLNDGFGTPFLFLPLSLLAHSYQTGPAVKSFLFHTVLYDVFLGSVLGVVIGYLARKALKTARRFDTIDRESMLVFSVALAVVTIGVADAVGTNHLLATFFAGTALNWTDKIRHEDLHSHFTDGIELFFDSSVFLVLGTIFPFHSWLDRRFLPPWQLVLLATCVLIFRRLPAILLLRKLVPLIKTGKEAIFVGHFGPIGVGALYYALIATDELPESFEGRDKIIAVVTSIIFASILVHGCSAPVIMLASQIPIPLSLFGSATDSEVGDPSETSPLLAGRPPVNGGSCSPTRIPHLPRRLSNQGDTMPSGGRGRPYPSMGEPAENLHHQRGLSVGRSPYVSALDEGRNIVLDDGNTTTVVRGNRAG